MMLKYNNEFCHIYSLPNMGDWHSVFAKDRFRDR